MPRDGHELTDVGGPNNVWWCIRCGALWFDSGRGHWEAPGQAGRSQASVDAPPCLPSTDAGVASLAGDAHLMLFALTHGWRCEPIQLPDSQNTEAWRWSHDGPLGGESWSVPGAWAAGPIVDADVRRLLLTTAKG